MTSSLKLLVPLVALAALSGHGLTADEKATTDKSSIRALLITGGCCHDYVFQAKAMQLAAKELGADIEWTVVNEGGKGTDAQIKFYDNPTWADGYDVVVHNECFANTTDADYIRKITEAHKKGVNAVVIHCAMHTYRAAKIDDWREFLGVTSRRHEHKSKYVVNVVNDDHPIMEGFPKDYQMPIDELYVIEKVWPNTKVLATSRSEKNDKVHPVFWTSKYGKAHIFGTTYGHSNETFSDKVFLRTLTQGILWASKGPGNTESK